MKRKTLLCNIVNTRRIVADFKENHNEAIECMEVLNDRKKTLNKRLDMDFYYVEVVNRSSRPGTQPAVETKEYYVSFTGSKKTLNPEPYYNIILEAERIS